MRTRIGVALLAVVLLAAGCGTTADKNAGGNAPAGTGTTQTVDPSVHASILAEQGIPPEPGPTVVAAYVADLDAVDKDIVHGKPDKAVDRGRNQCSSVKSSPDDLTKLVDLTNKRFTSPNHPNGFGPDKATKILAAVRKHLCP